MSSIALTMGRTLRFFDTYTSRLGWEVIPLLPGTKLPFMRGWTGGYDREAVRSYLAAHPDCNLGLRLGGIVDVESDTEGGNALLDDLTAGCPHPMYKSRRSVHHLFLTPEEGLTKLEARGIEFRGERHQSVLPPSVVGDVVYEWLPSALPVPPMPPRLLALYARHAKGDDKSGAMYVRPWCAACQRQSRAIHKVRFDHELARFKGHGRKWVCHSCR